ncbi:MAG: ATP-binding protein [Balneolaceae bacterium]
MIRDSTFAGIVLSLLFPLGLLAQGLPLKTHYSADDYNASRQNWSATQAVNGTMYIGNSAGILQFDGEEWSRIEVGVNLPVPNIFRSSEGTVFYGSTGDFGYLDTGDLYEPLAVSLAQVHLPDTLDFGEIHSINEVNGSVYFQTFFHLFEYRDGELTRHPAENFFGQLFRMHDRLFVNQFEVGMFEITEEGPVAYPPGNELSDDFIYGSATFGERVLLVTNRRGIVEMSEDGIQTFNNEINRMLRGPRVYRARKIGPNHMAIATLSHGLFIVDQNLDTVLHLTADNALASNVVYQLFGDLEGNLWALTDNGITVVHHGYEVQFIDQRDGISGAVRRIQRTPDALIVATTEGLFAKHTTADRFESQMPSTSVRDALSDGDGIWVIDPDKATRIRDGVEVEVHNTLYEKLYTDPDTGVFYFLRANGVDRLSQSDGETITNVFDTGSGNREMLTANGFFWIATLTDVRQYTPDGELVATHPVQGENDRIYFIRRMNDSVAIGTQNGLLIYDEEAGLFLPYSHDDLPDLRQVFMLQQCSDDTIWMRANRRVFLGTKEQENWSWRGTPYQLIARDASDSINYIHCDEEGVWMGGSSGIYKLNRQEWPVAEEVGISVTAVLVDRDSLIYSGFSLPDEPPVFTYQNNNVRFRFAAASFLDPDRNRYQVRLDGLESEWSSWSDEAFKDYTNLREGNYTLQVRGRNVFDIESDVASFRFTVLPPWHRTWWAYGLYLLAFGSVLYLAHYIRVRQILKIQSIRNRIAGDLHDEVSATLSSISYFAKAVERTPEKGSERFVSLIAASADDAKEKITDIIWAINPSHDDWNELTAKCRRYASDLLESKGVAHIINVDESISGKPELELRQHFWLIFKEIVTNAVRHSNADGIQISMELNRGTVMLTVSDNGDGFDPETVKRGNGLNNIVRRAEHVGGRAVVNSTPGTGTEWRVYFPI